MLPQKVSEGQRTPPMRTGQEGWGCLVWKRGGSRETFLQFSSTCRRLKMKTEKSLLPGLVTTSNGFKIKQDSFRLEIRKKLFTLKYWNRLPREVVDASPLKTFQTDGTLSILI